MYTYFEIVLYICDNYVRMYVKIELHLHGIFHLAIFAKLVSVSQFTIQCKNNLIFSKTIEVQNFNRTCASRDSILNHSVFCLKT